MKKTNIWLRRAAIATAALAILGSASPALAVSTSTWGAEAWTNSSNTTVTVEDTSMNANEAKAEFYVHGSNELKVITAKNGKGDTTVSGKYSSGINKFRACNIRPASPDNCSSWVVL